MFRKLVHWFIVFGLSYLAEYLGVAQQGVAFIAIYLGISVVLLIFCILELAIVDVILKSSEYSKLSQRISLSAALKTMASISIVLLAVWLSTKLWNIDFLASFQIMTFGSCVFIPGSGTVKVVRRKPGNSSEDEDDNETD